MPRGKNNFSSNNFWVIELEHYCYTLLYYYNKILSAKILRIKAFIIEEKIFCSIQEKIFTKISFLYIIKVRLLGSYAFLKIKKKRKEGEEKNIFCSTQNNSAKLFNLIKLIVLKLFNKNVKI